MRPLATIARHEPAPFAEAQRDLEDLEDLEDVVQPPQAATRKATRDFGAQEPLNVIRPEASELYTTDDGGDSRDRPRVVVDRVR